MDTTWTATHTPGPWEINEGDGMAIAKVSHFAITAPCTPDIGSGLSRAENAANARLIAAAPDLLAALRGIFAERWGCPMCDSGVLRNPAKTHWDNCPYAKAEAAIAKVESGRVEPYPPFAGTDAMDGDENRP